MLISVIIPSYNEEEYIGRCLASLGKQELDLGDKLEIIVVDDGSTDQTTTKVKGFPKVKLMHATHQGAARARNRAAKYARGKILVFVDADMEFDSDCVMKLCKPIKENRAMGTFTKDEMVANWHNSVARCWNWKQDLPEKRRLPDDHPNEGSDFRAILSSEFERVNGFDDVGYNDTWSLVQKLGYPPKHAPGAKYYHYNPGSLREAFDHAKWVGKRRYKFGVIGSLVALLRSSLPVSLVLGVYKATKYREPMFMIFKPVHDFGVSLGILKMLMTGKTSK